MQTTIAIRGKTIALHFKQHVINIINTDELTGLLAHDAAAATRELAKAIQTTYHQLFNTGFNVSEDSIIVEIWGHVYADRFAEWLAALSTVAYIDAIAERIIFRCEIIDIGEHGYDDNRFVWDNLAPLQSAIAAFLP